MKNLYRNSATGVPNRDDFLSAAQLAGIHLLGEIFRRIEAGTRTFWEGEIGQNFHSPCVSYRNQTAVREVFASKEKRRDPDEDRGVFVLR
jgi:hypothetical protein